MTLFLQPTQTKKAFNLALNDYHNIPKGFKAMPAFAKAEGRFVLAALTGLAETIQRIALWCLRRLDNESSIKAPLIGALMSIEALFVASKVDGVYQR